MLRPHIVILGAGFGGMYAAKKLAPLVKKGEIELTIVNRTNYFLFTPLLHEVATGGLSPRIVAEPLREVFVHTGIHIVQGNVESINTRDRNVVVNGTTHKSTLTYDYLVVATGAETNYFNIPGADKFTFGLKDIMDAARIRSRIIDCFEQAMLSTDDTERTKLLSFAVVGGGPTGVELTAELAEFIDGLVKRYYSATHTCRPGDSRHCTPEEPRLTLIHMGNELLEQFKPSLRAATARRLLHLGVNLQLGSTVTSITRDGLTVVGNKGPTGTPSSASMNIPAATVLWSAGVKPIIPHFEGGTPTLLGNRLAVDEHFHLIGQDRVFALGDVAGYIDSHTKERIPKNAVPMLAQAAVAQAQVVAGNIIAAVRSSPLKQFHYHSKGSLVSVGQWFAVGEIYSMNIAGKLSWWIWRTTYLFKFASWPKRIQIAFEWTLALFYPRDITKLV